MKAVILIGIGFLLGIAFSFTMFTVLISLAALRSGRPPTKEEWRMK